ncbi:MAG: hypothetical protein EA402_00810 [Planctomycetota bacterium]|nr:MAG: hypothetical protein EA402_00810 [Planctomycetota bacterium]
MSQAIVDCIEQVFSKRCAMASITDTLVLKLAVSKGLVDKALAKEIFAQARSEGRDPALILVERGLLTDHGIEVLCKDAAKASAPKEIGGYRLGAKLGQGGMGAVYRATQVSMDREVAVKLIAPGKAGGQAAADRFMREARAAGKVNHPHVITVYDVGQVGGTLYLAMELVTGGDAEQAAQAAGGRLPERRALEIIRDAARGLVALEAAGLMHRDIKPANIFLAQDGSAKLADLGLARSADGDDRMTQTGATMGTPAYMSPEQADGFDDIDIRTDIYALGATLFALIVGHSPYRGNSPWAVMAAVIRDPFPDPEPAGCSATVAEIIRRCCAKNRDQRYTSANNLVAGLNELLRDGAPTAAASFDLSKEPAQGQKRQPSAAANIPRVRTAEVIRSSRSTWLLRGAIGAAVLLLLIIGLVAVRPGTDPASAPAPTGSVLSPQISASPTGPSVPIDFSANPPPERKAAPSTVAGPTRPEWAATMGQDEFGHWADLQVGEVTQRMRYIPPGTFLMGSPADEAGRKSDETQHEVTLTRGYWLANTECTQEMWQAVMGSNPSHFTGDPQRPVEIVTWNDAQAFMSRLNAQVPGLQARLPTEAEWEYAARAGTIGARYGDLDAIAWHNGNANSRTHPVGRKQANAWGLYDMIGNVWEWCSDWYGDYPSSTVTDPVGLASGSNRVWRGGGWNRSGQHARSAFRDRTAPGNRSHYLGFRLAVPEQNPKLQMSVSDAVEPIELDAPVNQGQNEESESLLTNGVIFGEEAFVQFDGLDFKITRGSQVFQQSLESLRQHNIFHGHIRSEVLAKQWDQQLGRPIAGEHRFNAYLIHIFENGIVFYAGGRPIGSQCQVLYFSRSFGVTNPRSTP